MNSTQQRITMPTKLEVYVRGATAPSGTKYIVISQGELSAWIPHTTFTVDEKVAKLAIAEAGMSFIGKDWTALQDDVRNVHSFPHEHVAEHAGWVPPDFLLLSAEAIPREGGFPPRAIFDADPLAAQTTGTLGGYIKDVIEPLRGQALPTLALCVMFAAPLLELTNRKHNFGFQMVAEGGTGKSTLQRIIGAGCGVDYVISFHSTPNSLEQQLALFHSMPVFVEELNLFGAEATGRDRGAKIKALAFSLAEGRLKSRYATKAERHRRVPFIYLASGNDNLEDLIQGASKATSRAAIDRLMTLKLGPDQKHGVFQFVPPGYKGAKHYAESLDEAAEANAGHLLRAYLEPLVAARAADEGAIRRLIKADIDRFSERAGVGQDDGSMARVADAFGLLLSGGLMARRFGILPAGYPVGDAILYCYRHFLVAPKPPLSFDKLFAEYLQKPGVRDLDKQGLRPMGDKLFAATPAFLKAKRGYVEVSVHEPSINGAMPGWLKLIQKEGTRCSLDRDKDHVTKKRVVRCGQTDRMVVILLPEGFLKS
jgi:hypothetical protein